MFSHYLMFDGCCAEALTAYADAFGGTITELMRYGDVPDPGFAVAADQRHLVLHATLAWDGSTLMASDGTGHTTPGDTMYVSVAADEAAVRRAWDALSAGGTVYLDLQPTFFAAAHGSLRDRFGVNWMFTAVQGQ